MKRTYPLKWILTLVMTFVFFVVTGVLYLLFLRILSHRDEEFFTLIRHDVLSESAKVATDISPQFVADDGAAVVAKLKQYVKKRSEIVAAGVLNAGRQFVYQSGETSAMETYLDAARAAAAGETILDDNYIVGAATIPTNNSAVSGSVVVVQSIENHQKQKRFGNNILILAMIGCVLYVAFSAYIIGVRVVKSIDSLFAASERIADGDLQRVDIKIHPFEEINRFGLSIKRLADAMHQQVDAIQRLTVKMSTVSKKTEGTMTTLASAAAQQAAAVNETAATVEEMEKSGQSSSANAKQIVAAAEKTAEVSKRGHQTVKKTYDIIVRIRDESHDISEKSRNLLNAVEEVGNIIQTVNSIAEQSKILAVNASIEAAKAGEFGSGFAVVAQEVKDLAQQSKDATLQITGTLTAIRDAIETMVSTAQRGKERTADGVDSIASAGAVMNDLSEAIRENSEFAKLIATNVQQQTVGLTQIAAAIEEINTAALENQNVSRDVALGTKQMNENLDLLTDLVDRWRIPDDDDG
jgi:methyl-accepting chemotaxis protein